MAEILMTIYMKITKLILAVRQKNNLLCVTYPDQFQPQRTGTNEPVNERARVRKFGSDNCVALHCMDIA